MMSPKKKLAAVPAPEIDRTLPFTEITIDGKVYKMCFQHRALAAAEDALLAKGHDVNILIPMLRRTFSSLRVLFAVSLYTYHPELDFAATQDWVTHDNLLEVIQAVDESWNQSHAEKKPADPPTPGE
jgi:hypothetical protein